VRRRGREERGDINSKKERERREIDKKSERRERGRGGLT